MGDPSKFRFILEYYIFNFAFVSLLLAELFIFIYTLSHNGMTREAKHDHGTKWLLYLNFSFCLFVSVYSVSKAVPEMLRCMLLPAPVADIGLAFILLGISIRLCAVLTLRKAFTLKVQTAEGQRLITFGIYRKVRHPAYSGSILSLLGVALAFRNIAAVCVVLTCCFCCYKVRIQVEESVMHAQFGNEYDEYKNRTYMLFPYII